MSASGPTIESRPLPEPHTGVSAELQSRRAPDWSRGAHSSGKNMPVLENRNGHASVIASEISFGPFRLFPTKFLVLEDDKPLALGSRALEILTVLVEQPGKLVTREELMARVWPNVIVEPANLTVHVSALRRMLRDGQDGNRFIVNIPGRGYSFVASVVVVDG